MLSGLALALDVPTDPTLLASKPAGQTFGLGAKRDACAGQGSGPGGGRDRRAGRMAAGARGNARKIDNRTRQIEWNLATPEGRKVAWFKDPDGNAISASQHS